METLAIPYLLLVGALLALQAGANVQLATAMAHPVGASALQLTIGAALLLALTAVLHGLGALDGLDDVAAWHLVGGLGSAVYITAGILLFPRLGAVLTVGLFIAGQMLASLGLDGFGVLGVPHQTPDAVTMIGTLAVLAGAGAIVFGQKGATSDLSISKLGWILLALLAGAVLPVQGAINALLRNDIGAPFVVGTVSFVVATLAMVVVLLITLALTDAPKPQLAGLASMPWWGWLGAVCGATYVTTVFTAIPVIGTAAAVGLTVAGQQIASLFVDRWGWFRLPKREISALRFRGVALLLIGVALIQVF
jgi:bacterial/archaeal transporter family-2 protein